ncbi:MAG TPA: hypothetical protein VIM00_05085 [Candidatus Acidoferrum sp.]
MSKNGTTYFVVPFGFLVGEAAVKRGSHARALAMGHAVRRFVLQFAIWTAQAKVVWTT